VAAAHAGYLPGLVFSVGLYLPGVPAAEGQPGVFRLIGVANLLYLIARLWLFASWLRAFPGSGTG
jgi:hypothetical protein